MRFDTAGHQLALEIRDADVLLTYFYTYHTVDHALKQVLLPVEQTWWQGLEDAHASMLLLHGYGDRKLGQHKGVKAYATEKGAMQWKQPELTFYGVAAEGLLAYETAAPENGFLMLDTENGKLIRKGLAQQEAAALVQQYAPERYASCTYPVSYRTGETYFEDVRQFMYHTSGEEPVQAVEYAEFNQYIVISYYLQQTDNKLCNYLSVFDSDGNLLLKDCIGQGLTGLGSDTFIIFNQNLFFVQHKDILKVYTLF